MILLGLLIHFVQAGAAASGSAIPPPPPPPPFPRIARTLAETLARAQFDAYAAHFTTDAVLSRDGRVVAHGRAEISARARSDEDRGCSFWPQAAVVSPREIWVVESGACVHDAPPAGWAHGRLAHYRLNGEAISSLEATDVPNGFVMSPYDPR